MTSVHSYLLHGFLVTRKIKVLINGRMVPPVVYRKVVA